MPLPFLLKNSKPVAALLIAILIAAISTARTRAVDPTASGTVITNRAEAKYEAEDGNTYSVISETVSFTMLAVSSLTVGPKETTPSASVVPQQRIERVFNICNTG